MDTLYRHVAVAVALIWCVPSLVVAAEEVKQGQWGSWGPPSPCSVTCGSGTTSMERVWIPGTNEQPFKVPFTSTQVFSCTDETYPECPQNGTWSGWGSWSGCTRACGTGMRERHRECRGVLYGGKPCEGDKFNKEECNREPCPPLPKDFDISQCKDESNFTCASNKMCIPLNQKCDSTIHCHDGSDEEDCQNYRSVWGDNIRYDLNMRRNDAWSTFSRTMIVLVCQLVIVANILYLIH